MKSHNFEFLRIHQKVLAELGGFAEHYVHSDPASALVKLRQFGEQLVLSFLQHFGIQRLPQASFLELLNTLENHVPPVILTKLHALRSHGNKGAHGSSDQCSAKTALWLCQEAYTLGQWLALVLYEENDAADHTFQIPVAIDSRGALKREKKAALEKLAQQEVQMKKLLQDLAEAQQKAVVVEPTAQEQENIQAQATQASNAAAEALSFNEAKTRSLIIDHMLIQAGWDVSPNFAHTEAVGKEVKVLHQSTASGVGYADYVLWDDNGKPLAVVEAKKTSVDAEQGRIQAQGYAEGLEQEYGQRPVIFYTNGYDIFIWDDAKGEVPRKLFGYYTKESLQHCLWKNTNRLKLTDLGPVETIINRRYQIEAVKQICERLENKRRQSLLVLATGCGKTRVAIAFSEVLIRAKWAKRILFLCDRKELRKQAKNAYNEHLPSEPSIYVKSSTAHDRNQSIYLATYPAMNSCFQNYDVGFFDLVIADESHRSIYNRYRAHPIIIKYSKRTLIS